MKQEFDKAEIDQRALDAARLGAHVVITGAWVWVTFAAKPSDAVRGRLKTMGFRWSKNKEAWYFAGRPSLGRKSMPWDYITAKYGEEEVVA